MRMTEITLDEATPVDGYGPGFFRVAGQVIEGAVLVTATSVRGWQGYDDPAPLLAHVPADLRDRLHEAGLGVEAMNSPAACRTYNVLLSEGRRVALAALPV